MKILFATNHFWNYTGSELNLIGLARAMAARGHEVACCALVVSPALREGLREMGLRLLASTEHALVEFAPDAVFCQHHSAAAMVRSRLPATPMALAHLGVEPELEQAPLLDCGAGLHLAISEEVRDRLVSQGVSAGKMAIFRNSIDLRLHGDPADRAARSGAVLFSYKLPQDVAGLVASATQRFGMVLDTNSLTTMGVQAPPAVAARLRSARLVFASGRSALESALGGAAVVVLGPKGLDGALTAQSWRDLAQANFSGRRHARVFTEDSVREAIAEALQSDVAATRRELESVFSLDRRAAELDSLLCELPAPVMSPGELVLLRRLSQLLQEQRLLAAQQRDEERELELAVQASRAPWWLRLVRRVARQRPRSVKSAAPHP